MRHRSAKKEAEYKLRRPFVKSMLEDFPICQACAVWARHDGHSVVRERQSVDVHELVRRSQGGSILDRDNCITVCRPCHFRINAEPALAVELGLAQWGMRSNPSVELRPE